MLGEIQEEMEGGNMEVLDQISLYKCVKSSKNEFKIPIVFNNTNCQRIYSIMILLFI